MPAFFAPQANPWRWRAGRDTPPGPAPHVHLRRCNSLV